MYAQLSLVFALHQDIDVEPAQKATASARRQRKFVVPEQAGQSQEQGMISVSDLGVSMLLGKGNEERFRYLDMRGRASRKSHFADCKSGRQEEGGMSKLDDGGYHVSPSCASNINRTDGLASRTILDRSVQQCQGHIKRYPWRLGGL